MTDTDYELSDLFTQDGHLTELTLDRLVAGELSARQQDFIEDHVGTCPGCDARRDAVSRLDADFAFAPSPSVVAAASALETADVASADKSGGAVVDLGRARERRRGPLLGGVGLLLAAAAALFFVTQADKPAATVTPGEDDGIRLKGASLSLEVYAKADGGQPRAVGDGDVVHAGDRLGFRVTSRTDGYAMIAGADDSGEIYPVYPASSRTAKFLAGDQTSREIEAAIRLDDAGQRERLVLARCPGSFEIGDLASVFQGAPDAVERPSEDRMKDCVYDDVVLTKKPR